MTRGFRKAVPVSIIQLLVILLVAASCRTTPLITPATKPALAASPGELLPQWEPFAENITPALSFFAGKVREPRLELWAVRVDLEAPGLRIVVNGPDPLTGEFREGYIPSTTVSRFVSRYDCLVGINANPYSLVSGKTQEDRAIDGIAVANGVVVSRPRPGFDALVFYEGPLRAAIVSQAELSSLEGIRNAVGGFRIVLRDGETAKRLLPADARLLPADTRLRTPAAPLPRHPRSAAGLSWDGRWLYLLAVDGRRPGSVGATEAELAELLLRLGASEGLNFDGGGSTSLALRFPNGKVRPVNSPIHNRIPGWERKVAICLGIGTEDDAR
ncbi:MAG: phosphodiester glycosidase family protein [Treponema sp.]|jgi:hypothetical protein|nr:phosphodiester glycosidase family protein [Treponema sp.]